MIRLIIISTLLLVFAGAAYSVHEALTNKYTVSNLPQQGEPGFEYWNPHNAKHGGGESWKSKYKNYPEDQRAAYPGAKTWLAWTTDGDHLTIFLKDGAMRAVTILLAFALIGEGIRWPQWKKWGAGIALWLAMATIQSIGFHLTNLIILQ